MVTAMRQEEIEEIWDVDGAQRYDSPGTGMFAPEVLEPTVDRLAELAGAPSALCRGPLMYEFHLNYCTFGTWT